VPQPGLGSRPPRPPDTLAGLADPDEAQRPRKCVPLDRLLHEYKLYLRRRGRSPRTIRWYEQKIDWYLHNGGVQSLEELTKAEFERYLDDLWERKLAPNTIHGCFEAMKAFLNWAARAKYDVDPEALEVEAPAVPEYEIEVYSERQLEATVQHCPMGWARLAVLIL
jgi:site-specific recombinase XerD